MTPTELDRLAAVGSAMRPDWPLKSMRTFLETHFKARSYRDVAVALAWVATTDTQTPRLLLEAGAWWKAATVTDDGHMQRPPRKADDCPKHPGNWASACAACAADKLAGDDSTYNPRRMPAPAATVALARAELAQARTCMCIHGVKATSCLDRHVEHALPGEVSDERLEEA